MRLLLQFGVACLVGALGVLPWAAGFLWFVLTSSWQGGQRSAAQVGTWLGRD